MIDFEHISAGESVVIGRRTRPGLPLGEAAQDVEGILTPVEGAPGVFAFRYDFVQVWEIEDAGETFFIPSDLRKGDRFATFPEGDELGLREKDVYRVEGVVVVGSRDHYEAKLVPWTESDSLESRRV